MLSTSPERTSAGIGLEIGILFLEEEEVLVVEVESFSSLCEVVFISTDHLGLG